MLEKLRLPKAPKIHQRKPKPFYTKPTPHFAFKDLTKQKEKHSKLKISPLLLLANFQHTKNKNSITP